jgi:hypothetical protein
MLGRAAMYLMLGRAAMYSMLGRAAMYCAGRKGLCSRLLSVFVLACVRPRVDGRMSGRAHILQIALLPALRAGQASGLSDCEIILAQTNPRGGPPDNRTISSVVKTKAFRVGII